jgi:hypothetical protein
VRRTERYSEVWKPRALSFATCVLPLPWPQHCERNSVFISTSVHVNIEWVIGGKYRKVGFFWIEMWRVSIDGTRFLGLGIGRGMIYLLTYLWIINESVVGQALSRRMEG